MTNNGYNGWTNKETWLVNLWLRESFDVVRDTSTGIDAEGIESIVEELIDEQVNEFGFVRDLINCALGEINYRELADHVNEWAAA